MYTQCPECSTAFRVTADVLKQAAGKVRCGGCGNAFNALEYLSEAMPEQAEADEPLASAAAITAEPAAAGEGSPKSISAEQSAALLKTLDELAGPDDIRIEDTGVEWRVLDDEVDTDVDADVDVDVEELLDELLDESPTPVDQFLTSTPSSVEASEIFEESANAPAQTPVEELRFDDDTPLPDDFDLDDESSYLPESAAFEEFEIAPEPGESTESTADSDDPGDDIDLGEADEWADILHEVDDTTEPETADGVAPAANDWTLTEVEAEPDDEDTRNRSLDDEAPGDEPEEHSPIEFGSVDTAIKELEEQSDVFDQDFFADAEETSAMDGGVTETRVDTPESDDELSLDAVIEEDEIESTHAIEEESEDEKSAERIRRRSDQEDDAVGFESIVMEGEFVRTALSDEKRDADVAAAAALAERAKILDEAEAVALPRYDRRQIGMIIALAVVLMFQLVHQSRDRLATIPAINNVLGPAYQAIGRPILPAWDVTGWRFEATDEAVQGDAATNNEQLTISSRLGNKSDEPLAYPLISLSLTDRFEETIGSRVLSPTEYLGNGADLAQLVQPGGTFFAVISVQSPSAAATGYKLKACYRLSEGQLRCNMPDFR